MDEKEEIRKELEQELQWVQHRQKMMDIIEEKLIKMKELAQQAKDHNLRPEEIKVLNAKLNRLASQVNALDEDSRKTEYQKTDE